MKRLLLIAGIMVLSIVAVNARETETLSDGWNFSKIEKFESGMQPESMEAVTVPHTWNTDLINGNTYYLGKGLYTKNLQITKDADKRYFLRFEGALTIAEVYINGKSAGRHEGGYSAFCFEITELIQDGSNRLEVMVDNSYNNDITPVSNSLFTRFGGIYRPVTLLTTSNVNISPLDFASPGVYISPLKVSEKEALIDVKTLISGNTDTENSYTLNIAIKDKSGKITAQSSNPVKAGTTEMSQKMNIYNPNLWNAKEDPYLYSVTVNILDGDKIIDTVVQPLGLRYFHVDRKKGFFLNGKHIDLYGVNRHQEWEKEGTALTDEHHRHDVEKIMEIGANGVRLAHYQQADTMYSLCDEKGLVVWAEVPITPPYQKNNDKYKANCRQQITELIKQNYNHPSIFFWGMYNEINISTKDVKMYHKLAKKLDPNRLTTAASNKPLGRRHSVTDLICWNRYPYWYGGQDISKWHKSIRFLRPFMKTGVSEYGAGGCVDQHDQNPEKPDGIKGKFYPEEYQAQIHERIWADIRGNDAIWGKYIWNMFDFSWPVVNRGNREFMNHKGLVTYDRQTEKDSFFFYKANWRDDVPVLYITSRRHVNRDEAVTNIKVYSNCGDVKFFLNGKELETITPDDLKRAIYKEATLKKGSNIIKVTATFNGEEVTDTCEWILK
jgi:beta-galactosidase